MFRTLYLKLFFSTQTRNQEFAKEWKIKPKAKSFLLKRYIYQAACAVNWCISNKWQKERSKDKAPRQRAIFKNSHFNFM